jgi:hypothetical protein
VLAITVKGDYFLSGTHCANPINIQPPRVMATKKTAKKTAPASSAAANGETPVAKKAAKAVKKVAAKKAAKPAERKAAAKPTPDELARAAYLNYRRRVEQGLPGDSHADWLEAVRYYSSKGEG